MKCKAKGFEIRRKALVLFLLSGITVLWQLPALATQSVTLGWEPSVDPSVVGYNIYYGTISHDYTNKVSVGNVTNATITGLIEGTTYYFAATTDDASGDESGFSNEASYAVPLVVNNHPPTLNALGNVTLNENAAAKTVALSGITSGAAAEVQTLAVTASSSNPSLIPNPTVNYTSANTTGSLTFAPVAYASGKAVITVTVNDGGFTNNLVQRTFTVIVNPVNQPPTLDPISNVSLNENAASQTIALTGISSGAPNENQKLKVTATSSRPALIPNPTVSYTSPNATGSLTFKPATDASGTATLTVTVSDGTKTVAQSFTVTVVSTNALSSAVKNSTSTSAKMTAAPAETYSVSVTNNIAGSTSASTGNLTVEPTPPATLTQTVYENGQYAFYVSGASGSQYVVQASTDLVNWVSVETNTAPFTFVDADAGQFSQRFYRAVSPQ